MSDEPISFGWTEIAIWREELPRLLEDAQKIPDRIMSVIFGAVLTALQKMISAADEQRSEVARLTAALEAERELHASEERWAKEYHDQWQKERELCDRLAAELRLEQNPGYECAVLREYRAPREEHK